MRLALLLILVSYFASVALPSASFAEQNRSSLNEWMHAEQSLLHRRVDTGKMIATDANGLPIPYRPESRQWFPLKSIWLPESELDVVELESMIPPELRPELIRTQNGQKQFRFFIHPESENFYRDWLSKYPVATDYRATPSSSGRSLLVESLADPSKTFIVKLSIDSMLSGINRTIPNGEVAQSIGVTQYFLDHLKDVSTGFKIIPEVLGLSPKGRPRGGQIIRLIPEEVLNGKSRLVPLFSLYTRRGNAPTLIETMARKEGKTPYKFVVEKILKPFARAWCDWAVKGALVAEDHAQNVLLELDSEGNPTGNFFLRDGGGFYINPHSPSLRAGELAQLPTLNGFQWDYQKFADVAETQSLNIYFSGGFLYNLGIEFVQFEPGYKPGAIYDDFWNEISNNLVRLSGDPKLSFTRSQLENEMSTTLKTVREAFMGQKYRDIEFALGRPLRIGVYTDTFDPPHAGHAQELEVARARAGLDLVYVLPDPSTPDNPNAPSFEDRKEMSKRAFSRNGVIVGDKKVEDAQRNGGFDEALRALMASYDPGTQFYRIMGEDGLQYYEDHPQALTAPNVTFIIQRGSGQVGVESPQKQVGKAP